MTDEEIRAEQAKYEPWTPKPYRTMPGAEGWKAPFGVRLATARWLRQAERSRSGCCAKPLTVNMEGGWGCARERNHTGPCGCSNFIGDKVLMLWPSGLASLPVREWDEETQC